MDNSEKLATSGAQYEEQQNKNTTQYRETNNIGYTRRGKTKQKHNTICVGHHITQTTQIT